eukprot:353339-Chlamydomonas_euryale.AAC.2
MAAARSATSSTRRFSSAAIDGSPSRASTAAPTGPSWLTSSLSALKPRDHDSPSMFCGGRASGEEREGSRRA